MWSILIIDDYAVARRGLAQILREEFGHITFSEAANPGEALMLAQNRTWDLMILGVNPPGNHGLGLLREIRRTCPDAQILTLGVHSEHLYAAHSMKLGASGYVSKDDPRAKLVKGIQRVLAGKKYCPKLFPISSVMRRPEPAPGTHELSSREQEVLAMLAAGKRLTDIAADLNVSCKTVSTHKRRLFDKMRWVSTVDMLRCLEGAALEDPRVPEERTHWDRNRIHGVTSRPKLRAITRYAGNPAVEV